MVTYSFVRYVLNMAKQQVLPQRRRKAMYEIQIACLGTKELGSGLHLLLSLCLTPASLVEPPALS